MIYRCRSPMWVHTSASQTVLESWNINKGDLILCLHSDRQANFFLLSSGAIGLLDGEWSASKLIDKNYIETIELAR